MNYSLFLGILPRSILVFILGTHVLTSTKGRTTLPASIKLPFTMKSSEQVALEKFEQKRKALFEKIVEAFTENDEKKNEFLRQPYEKVPEIENCYLEAFGTFLAQCSSINHYDNLKQFKDLCHRICASGWFETEDIWKRLGQTCDANKNLTL